MVNYWKNERKATSFVRTRTNQGASAATRVQGGTRFSHGQQRTNPKGKTYFHKTKTNRRKCRSVVSKMQGGIHFVQWRIWRRRIIRTRFWKSHSRNIAFFCFFFLLTADTFRDEALVASLFESWLNHVPLSLSARFCLLSGWNYSIFFMFSPGFVLLVIQGLFFVLERFMTTKWIGFEIVTTVIECKQKMLSSWN